MHRCTLMHDTLSHDTATLRHGYGKPNTCTKCLFFFFFNLPPPLCAVCLDHMTPRLRGSLEFHTFKSKFHKALHQMCVIGTGRVRWQLFLPETRHADSYVLQWMRLGPRFRLQFGLIIIHYVRNLKLRTHGYKIASDNKVVSG